MPPRTQDILQELARAEASIANARDRIEAQQKLVAVLVSHPDDGLRAQAIKLLESWEACMQTMLEHCAFLHAEYRHATDPGAGSEVVEHPGAG